jgi:3-oxoacyl-[acyl-carrier-protein] synthase-3
MNHLNMNGAEVMAFSLVEVPAAIDDLLQKDRVGRDQIDFFVLHQANRFMLEALRKKLRIPVDKLPILMEDCGNTVSSTIPFAMIRLREEGRLVRGKELVLAGFGVGYSWACCRMTF